VLEAFNCPAQILRTKVELASKAAHKAKALPTRTLPRAIQRQGNELLSPWDGLDPIPLSLIGSLGRRVRTHGWGFLLLMEQP